MTSQFNGVQSYSQLRVQMQIHGKCMEMQMQTNDRGIWWRRPQSII